jgi:hypothetical protein
MNMMDQKKEFETQEKIIEMIGEKDKAQRKRDLIPERLANFSRVSLERKICCPIVF